MRFCNTSRVPRLPLLDVLRGFALFGIFLINLGSFTGFIFMTPADMAATATAAIDKPIAVVILWLAYGKFYSLFSLLFGIGFALQLGTSSDDSHAVGRFRRRLLVLLGIGVVHLFIWEGDILAFYALIGFLLVPLRALSQPALLKTAVLLIAMPVVLHALIVATGGLLDPGAPLRAAGQRHTEWLGYPGDTKPFPFLRDAGWADYVRFQSAGFWFRYADLLTTGRPFKVLAMFLVGLWVGRSGMLTDLQAWTPALRRVRAAGLIVGLPASLAQVVLMIVAEPRTTLSLMESLAYALGVAPLALAYAAHITLVWQSPRWNGRLVRLMPAGRMALSIYLSQTVVAIALFYGVGLGLMGRVGPAFWLPLALVVVGGQAWLAWRWLGRYRQGPMEWLWRRAAYGSAGSDSSSRAPRRLP